MRPDPLYPSNRASVATWSLLAFLAGLIIGLASCKWRVRKVEIVTSGPNWVRIEQNWGVFAPGEKVAKVLFANWRAAYDEAITRAGGAPNGRFPQTLPDFLAMRVGDSVEMGTPKCKVTAKVTDIRQRYGKTVYSLRSDLSTYTQEAE